jgi:hypothetical protein
MITYATETWILKESMKLILLITEKQILRKISGHTKDREGIWGIKTNLN